jgi:hypothetical protein
LTADPRPEQEVLAQAEHAREQAALTALREVQNATQASSTDGAATPHR